jgi:chitin synthase
LVNESKAETDVPECVEELFAQRRRWLNGGLATTIYYLMNVSRLYHSAHGWWQLGLYRVQAAVCLSTYCVYSDASYSYSRTQYNLVSLIFSFFALANVWLWFKRAARRII